MPILAQAHVVDGRLTLASDLVVPWWSLTKVVIAAAALALVREGLLDLDREIEQRGYTLRQLLQHQAGLGDYGELPDYHGAVARGDRPWPVTEMLKRAEAGRLRYLPGEGWGYSNIGYLAAGTWVAKAARTSLAEALQLLVLGPLGVQNVRLATTPQDLADVAMGEMTGYDPAWVYHGLLVGPLSQAALMLDRLLSGDLLPPPLMAAMQTGFPVGEAIPGRPWVKPSYGLGLMMEGALAHGPRGHTGGGPGSVISVYRRADTVPVQTIAAFALGNDAGEAERTAFAPL